MCQAPEIGSGHSLLSGNFEIGALWGPGALALRPCQTLPLPGGDLLSKAGKEALRG